MIQIKQIFVGGHDKNFSYVLYDESSKEGAIVDPSGKIELVIQFIETKNIHIKYLINTHAHHDHVEKNKMIQKKYSVLCVMHKEENYPKDLPVLGGEEWKLGDQTFKFIHTPGHTPGSMCILANHQLITGDTLFVGRSGRTIFLGGNSAHMFESMEKLSSLDDQVLVFPGHDYGDRPVSTIGHEKQTNKCMIAKTMEEFQSLGI